MATETFHSKRGDGKVAPGSRLILSRWRVNHGYLPYQPLRVDCWTAVARSLRGDR